ncbi:MAG: single-stranded DNA-binding protein [Alphaproteobacteria bacterium]|nr:single-stranded DNA-binding protein [Alphaproteobacteria bacterium]
MSGSLNKVTLIGNLGRDPEIRSMNSGDRVCNLAVATSERWKDRQSGEQREKTEWHRVVVFDQQIVDVCERFLKKGRKVYLEGQLQTRKWTNQEGQERYTTEVVLQRFRGQLIMIDGARDASGDYGSAEAPVEMAAAVSGGNGGGNGSAGAGADDLVDEIPF